MTEPKRGSWLVRTGRRMRADREGVAAAGVLLAGVLLRLWFLPDARFTGDEGAMYEAAVQLAREGGWPWLGPLVSDGGAYWPGGGTFLLLAAPLTFHPSPYAAMVWVVLLNTAGYALLHATVRRVRGRRVALVFLVVLVFSPWTVFYSDRVWNINLLMPFLALALWALVDVVERRRSPRITWLALALFVMAQLHLSVGVLAVVFVVTLALHRARIRWGRAALGVVLGIVTYLPYIVRELANGFSNTRGLLSAIAGGGHGGVSGWSEGGDAVLGFLLSPTAEMSYFLTQGYWFGYDPPGYYLSGPGLAGLAEIHGGGFPGTLMVVGTVLSILAIAAALVWLLLTLAVPRLRGNDASSRRRDPLTTAFVVALLVTGVPFALTGRTYFPHYNFVLLPLAFVPLVSLVSRLVTRPRGYAVVLAVTALHAAVHIAGVARCYTDVERRWGLAATSAIADAVIEVAGDRPCRLEYDIDEDNIAIDPILGLARSYRGRPIALDANARLRFRVVARERFFPQGPDGPPLRALDGTPLAGSRPLGPNVLVWTDAPLP